jgi:hypothetical protein
MVRQPDTPRYLPQFDRKRIAEAICATDALPRDVGPAGDYGVEEVGWPEEDSVRTLLPELILQREMMISVATGGERIQDVNDYYIARCHKISELVAIAGVDFISPFDDLWAWYHFWKDNLPSYSDRRRYVADLFKDAIRTVSQRAIPLVSVPELTGWERVDRGLTKVRNQLQNAVNEEDFQTIGLMCREIIISLAQEVYIPEEHGTLDGVRPSKTDAARMLDAYLSVEFPGSSNKEVRAHARAALNLALNLQHRRTATAKLARLCLEATSSTVSVIAIISGRDTPKSEP